MDAPTSVENEKEIDLSVRVRLLENKLSQEIERTKSFVELSKEGERQVKKVSERLDRIDPHSIEPLLSSLEGRVGFLNGRFEALLLRNCVFSEVLRSCDGNVREMVLASMMRVWDMDDAWWLSRGQLSVKEWRIELLDIVDE
jgi:hypothetical protein